MATTPHYIREYQRLLQNLRKKHGGDEAALQAAVGGNYEQQGQLQRQLVMAHAPDGHFTLFDAGCGSGRAAYALRDLDRLTYHGTDILPDLLDYAHTKCARPDWKFETVTGIALPAADDWADMVIFMSVFTHLKPPEINAYLREAARVLKPGGVLICSFLDRDFEPHRKAFRPALLQRIGRWLGRDVMLSFTTKAELSGWLEQSGFSVEKVETYATARQHTLIARRNRN